MNNENRLNNKNLESVSGGRSDGYQLYYNGTALPMDQTAAQVCKTYPEILDKLGNYYYLVYKKTLNELCESLGEAWIQSLIDSNS